MLVGVNDDQCLNCGRRNPGMFGFGPILAKLARGGLEDVFLTMVVVVCGLLYIASMLVGGVQMGGFMNMLSPGPGGLFLFGASGAFPVFEAGRWWTVMSASWLHGSLLHILFNMYMVRQMAPAVIEFYGLSRTVILYTLSGAVGFGAPQSRALAGGQTCVKTAFYRLSNTRPGVSLYRQKATISRCLPDLPEPIRPLPVA